MGRKGNLADLFFTFLCLSPLFSSLFSSLPPPFLSDLLGSELVETLLSSVTEFLSAKSREVVRSTLIFIKVRERERERVTVRILQYFYSGCYCCFASQ